MSYKPQKKIKIIKNIDHKSNPRKMQGQRIT